MYKENKKADVTEIKPEVLPEAPPVKRYYGRKKGNESDSELSLDSDGRVEEHKR